MTLRKLVLHFENGLTVILSPTNKDPTNQAYVAIKAKEVKQDPATNTGFGALFRAHVIQRN